MKFNGQLALRAAIVVVVLAGSVDAFAAGSVFKSGLFKSLFQSKSEPVYESDAFFGDEALTLGDMSFSEYEASEIDGFYGECASCAGNADPAPISYSYPVAYDYAPSYSYSYAPTTYVVPERRSFRPVRSLLRGVRSFLFGNFNYCRPAYVCDPCWNVCDPCCDPCCDWSPCVPACDPCANVCATPCEPCAPACEPCAPTCAQSVYAPRSCCGDGYYPGEVNELDPTTGTSKGGIGATLKSAPKEAPKKLSAQDEDVNAPAVPEENQLPSYDSSATEPSIESIPTPEPTGAGVIRMLVPEDSVVYVNGYRTKQSGETRTFAAKNLKYGETYEFEIRVVAVRNGQTVEDVQTAVLTAGEKTALAFNPKPRRANEAIAFNK